MSKKQNNRRANLYLLIFDCPFYTEEWTLWLDTQGPDRLLGWTVRGEPVPDSVVREIAQIFDHRFSLDDLDLNAEKIFLG